MPTELNERVPKKAPKATEMSDPNTTEGYPPECGEGRGFRTSVVHGSAREDVELPYGGLPSGKLPKR
jgi:hypothetical protein